MCDSGQEQHFDECGILGRRMSPQVTAVLVDVSQRKQLTSSQHIASHIFDKCCMMLTCRWTSSGRDSFR